MACIQWQTGVFSPSSLAEGASTNLRVRMDYTNISLYRLVRYSTAAVSQKTADNRLHVSSLNFTKKNLAFLRNQ